MTDKNTDFQKVLDSSKDTIENIKKKRDTPVTATPRNLAFVGLFVFAILFIGTIALQIISGIIAIFVTIVFGTASFFILKHARKLDPLIAQKVKNYVLEQQMKEAQENSIIQLQSILLSRKDSLEDAYGARSEMGGYLEKLKMKLKKSDPSDMYYEQKQSVLEKVQRAYNKNGEVLEKAKSSLKAFEEKVYHYKEMAEFTAIAGNAMSALENDHLENMLSLEAFDTIETEFCTAMADLDTSVELADI